jgi:hypothetical protein
MIIPGMNTNTDGKVEETIADIAITTITIINGINKDLFTFIDFRLQTVLQPNFSDR